MKLIPLFAVFLLSACTNVAVTSPIDQREKVIAVPVGGNKLCASVKAELRSHGWKVIASEGLQISPGGGRNWSGDRGILARYTMHLKATHLEGIGPNWVAFDASVVDNKTSEEVMTVSSNDTTVSLATGSIMKALGEK